MVLLAGDGSLDGLLERLAERAELHERMLYRFHCTEQMTRRVYRVAGSETTEAKGRARSERFGLVVTRDSVIRQKLRPDGTLALGRDGRPIEVRPSKAFKPIVGAVPQAAVSWLTAEQWEQLAFTALDGPCPGREWTVEFTDRRGPHKTRDGCSAIASGRMCVDQSSGEVSRIRFYPVYEEGDACLWDRANPFVTVEQAQLDPTNGIRFPSEVTTVYPLEVSLGHSTLVREYAIFTQTFHDCVFPEIRVRSEF